MKTRLLAIGACTLSLLCAGCTRPAEPNAAASSSSSNSSAPHRIVALAPSITELVYAAGAGQYLVAKGAYSNYPPEAAAVPEVGDAFRVDFERLLALKPDLVLVWPSGTPATVLEQIRKLGLRVEDVEVQRIHEVSAALLHIGEVVGTQAAAQQAAQQFDADMAALRQRYADRKPLRVFIEVNRKPLYTVGKQQIISEMVELCGGMNVFADIGTLAPEIGVEAVLKTNPQVILSTDATGVQLQQEWRDWPQLEAVKHGHLYVVSPDLVTRAGPRLVQGTAEVCRVLDEARQGASK